MLGQLLRPDEDADNRVFGRFHRKSKTIAVFFLTEAVHVGIKRAYRRAASRGEKIVVKFKFFPLLITLPFRGQFAKITDIT